MRALENRWNDTEFYSVYEIAMQARIFVRRYGGAVSAVYCNSEQDFSRPRKVKLIVEYCCKIGNGADLMYYYLSLILHKKVNNEAHYNMISEEIKLIANNNG